MAYTRQRKHCSAAYRSGLEAKVCGELDAKGVCYKYEPFKLPYITPAKKHTYTPDIILSNGIIVELKGLFTLEDRKKHELLKEQHPDLDIRFVFQNPNNTISKGSKTRYCDWCESRGIPWAGKTIPDAWLNEEKPKSKKGA